MKRWIYFILSLIYIVACKRNTNDAPCLKKLNNYYLADSLYKWYDAIIDSGETTKNYLAKSSNGLSETIIVKTAYPSAYSGVSSCEESYYWGKSYSYKSTLYRNMFWISLFFKNSNYPAGLERTDRNIYTDQVDFKIHYWAARAPGVSADYVDLVQTIIPNYSTKLKLAYFNHLESSNITNFVICDTCIQFVGKYTQGVKTYDDVYRYISPLQYNGADNIEEFLIDKKHGVIKFTYKNGVSWTIEPF